MKLSPTQRQVLVSLKNGPAPFATLRLLGATSATVGTMQGSGLIKYHKTAETFSITDRGRSALADSKVAARPTLKFQAPKVRGKKSSASPARDKA